MVYLTHHLIKYSAIQNPHASALHWNRFTMSYGQLWEGVRITAQAWHQLDLSNNSIMKIENLDTLSDLKHLILRNNFIIKISLDEFIK